MEEALKNEDPGYDELKKSVIELSHKIELGLKPEKLRSLLGDHRYNFKKLKEDMKAPQKAAKEYIELHSGNEQGSGTLT